MAGRVGRKKEDPYGEVVVFSQVITQAMETSQKRIHFANQHVSTMLS
jgi:late competence protein required for DNA uptake (superfamily II DNA/RNA helicase)